MLVSGKAYDPALTSSLVLCISSVLRPDNVAYVSVTVRKEETLAYFLNVCGKGDIFS